ncbi:hypothetical protein RCL1_001467 [Eukaryota sp. TZLM3-RCL]
MSLLEAVSCSICLKLASNPIFLSCGHSLCIKCLTFPRKHSCSVCVKAVQSISSLSVNVSLRNLVQSSMSSSFKIIDVSYLKNRNPLSSLSTSGIFSCSFNGLDVLWKHYDSIIDSNRVKNLTSLMIMLVHPNIVTTFGMTENPLGVVVERLPQTLSDVLPLDNLSQKYKILKGILAGLLEIHSIGYVHRDISPVNILITANGEAKIADFDLMITDERTATFDGIKSTTRFIDPEILSRNNHRFAFKNGFYSYAVLVLQILTGKIPFEGLSDDQLLHAKLSNKFPFSDSDFVECNPQLVALAKSLMSSGNDYKRFVQELVVFFANECDSEEEKCFTLNGCDVEIDYNQLISQGPTFKIFKGKWDYEVVTIKIITLTEDGHEELAGFIDHYRSIPSNLVIYGNEYDSTVFGICRSGQASAIISVYCDPISLTKSTESQPLAFIQNGLYTIASQIKALHDNNIVHGRIKPENILSSGCLFHELVLVDAGISSIISKYNRVPLDLDTARYCAPEVIQNPSLCSKAADIYSFAVLAYEWITGERAFGAINSLQKMLEVKSRDSGIHLGQNLGAFPGNIPFSRFISPNPSERPTIDDVLNCFKVTVKILNRPFLLDQQLPEDFTVFVDDENTTIGEIFNKLSNVSQITPNHFLSNFIPFNKPLQLNTKLKDITNVSAYNSVYLILDSHTITFAHYNSHRIFINKNFGKTIALYVYPHYYLTEVLILLQQKEGIVYGQHIVQFDGKQLSDDKKSVGSYGIVKDSTLELILAIKGRKPIILFHPPSDGWALSLSVTLDRSFWTFTHVYPGKTFNNYTMNWNDLLIDSTGLISGSKDFSLPVSCLFWEAEAFPSVAKSLFDHNWEGSVVVPRTDCAKILHQNLLQVGFTPRDATEMVTYWQPTFEQIFKQNIEMVFVDPNVINNLARIDVTIKVPIYRFFIVFRGVDAACTSSIFLQDPFNGGYNRENCIMEWGGMHLLL